MTRWLLRMARWAQRPPSEGRIKLVLAIIVICLAVFAVEWMGWWPDWATAQKMRH